MKSNESSTRARAIAAIDSLEGVTVNAFAELISYLEKIPGIETFSVNPAEGDYSSLATLSYLSTLFEGDSYKPEPITLHVHHHPKSSQHKYDYSIDTKCGLARFEIARGSLANIPA